MTRNPTAARFSFVRCFGLMWLCVAAHAGLAPQALADSPRRDVQLIGLAPLYEALFAVANCPGLVLDTPAFRRAVRLYYQTPADLTPAGDFAPEIAQLAADDRVRLEDDRLAFCDARRLRFAVPQGILTDLGPHVPSAAVRP